MSQPDNTQRIEDTSRSRQQTVEQERAKAAWDAISSVPKQDQSKYGSLVRGMPATILRDGLGPALAFLKAKGEGHHETLYKHLSTWVTTPQKSSEKDLIEWILNCSSAQYRRTANEVQAYLFWLKRFAEAKNWKEEGAV